MKRFIKNKCVKTRKGNFVFYITLRQYEQKEEEESVP